MPEPVLSLITGKVNRDASFQRLVDSIEAYTEVPWELVVSDASETPYQTDNKRIRVIHEWPRQTCVKGYNNAFRAAKGKWCLYLNDDAEVCDGYAKAAIDFMESRPEIGLGALHYSDRGGPFHCNHAWKVIYANFGIISRELGNRIGWYDNALTMYGNDNSLTIRVLMKGYGVQDIPEAKVIHHAVQDQTRAENQHTRLRDNMVLQDTYMPHRALWQATFNKFYKHNGHIPWSHGQPPVSETLFR